MWTNAAPQFPCVTSMPIVRILAALIFVLAKLDLLGMEKLAMVNYSENLYAYYEN